MKNTVLSVFIAVFCCLGARGADHQQEGAVGEKKPREVAVAPPVPKEIFQFPNEKESWEKSEKLCDEKIDPMEKNEAKLSVRSICNLFNRNPQEKDEALPKGDYVGLCFSRKAVKQLVPSDDPAEVHLMDSMSEWKADRPINMVLSQGLVPERVLPSGILEGKRPQILTELGELKQEGALDFSAEKKAFVFGGEKVEQPGAGFVFPRKSETRVRYGKTPDGAPLIMTIKNTYMRGSRLTVDNKWVATAHNLDSKVCIYNRAR